MSTKDYELFKLRNDNREKIDKNHLSRMVESLRDKNLLYLKPILVNSKYEIIDGQHRFLAAKELGIELYYEVSDEIEAKDLIQMNLSLQWKLHDYLNFYVKNGYPEYIKLNNYVKSSGVHLRNCIGIGYGNSHDTINEFRAGKYVFNMDQFEDNIFLINKTIETINRYAGKFEFTKSLKFWRALIILFDHPSFNEEIWIARLTKYVYRIQVKVSTLEYCKLFQDIFNKNNADKVDLTCN
jgi:hypothetical protein